MDSYSIFISILFTIIIFIVSYIYNNYYYTESFDSDEKEENLDYKNNYLDGIDVIYWINLDRSIDRRKRMEKVFTDPVFVNIPIIRIPGVDGKSKVIKSILKANFTNLSNRYLTTEYGCTLSHLNAIQKFNNSNYTNALIMEDDMTLEFKKYWKKPIKYVIDSAPDDWDILKFTYITTKYKSNQTPIKLFTKFNGDYVSAGAYLINKKGSNKMNKINIMNKYNLPPSNIIPHIADQLTFLLCNTYTYKYPYFIYANLDSEIHINDVINDHIPSKKLIEELLQRDQ